MTDEQMLALWRAMRPLQGDPDPVAFGRAVAAETALFAAHQERDDLRFALASALGWPCGINSRPPSLQSMLQCVAKMRRAEVAQ